MKDVDYIKLSATARHIQETVFNRAAENGIKLSAETATIVMLSAVELARIAHLGRAGE